MKLTKAQQQIVLVVLVALLVLINGYFYLRGEKPKTAPLTYARGARAVSAVRQGPSSRTTAAADPLNVFLERRREKFPDVVRDIFRMENPAPKPKEPRKQAPPVHVKTEEEIAAEAAKAAADAAKAATEAAAQAARADMMKFQLLGYLTDKDSTLFLSKEGELFTVKKGSKLLKSYRVKEANKNYVILQDTVTGVEVQLELPGGEIRPSEEPQQQPFMPKRLQRNLRPVPAPGQ
jgi:hypothetical protein